MNQPPYPQSQPQYPPPQKSNTLLIVLLVIGVVLVVFGGMFAVMAMYGTRKYIANAKSAEAKNSIGQIARLASEAYTRDGKLCPSASAPVPRDPSEVSAKKYLARPGEWSADQAKNAGFACLKFEMDMPQYYQYDYRATATDFTVTARGDLNGNGIFSEYSIKGIVRNGAVEIAPSIMETNPQE